MKTHIYTPRLKNTGERLRLRLNDDDWIVANRWDEAGANDVRGPFEHGITVKVTGKKIELL